MEIEDNLNKETQNKLYNELSKKFKIYNISETDISVDVILKNIIPKEIKWVEISKYTTLNIPSKKDIDFALQEMPKIINKYLLKLDIDQLTHEEFLDLLAKQYIEKINIIPILQHLVNNEIIEITENYVRI